MAAVSAAMPVANPPPMPMPECSDDDRVVPRKRPLGRILKAAASSMTSQLSTAYGSEKGDRHISFVTEMSDESEAEDEDKTSDACAEAQSFSEQRNHFRQCSRNLTSRQAAKAEAQAALKEAGLATNTIREVGRPGPRPDALPPINGALERDSSEQCDLPIAVANTHILNKEVDADDDKWAVGRQGFVENKEAPVLMPVALMPAAPPRSSRYQSLMKRRANATMRHTFDVSVLTDPEARIYCDGVDTSGIELALDCIEEGETKPAREAAKPACAKSKGRPGKRASTHFMPQKFSMIEGDEEEAPAPLERAKTDQLPRGQQEEESEEASEGQTAQTQTEGQESTPAAAQNVRRRAMPSLVKQSRLRQAQNQL